MKGVSNIVLLLLILIIAISAISALWLAFHGYLQTITSSNSTSTLSNVLSSCMKIDSVNGNKVYLRNCGNGVVTNSSLRVYFDNVPVKFSMTSSSLGRDEIGNITLYNLSLWNMSLGENHKIKITTPSAEVERYVKTALPDSNVLDLEFDEGFGNKTYDNSPNHNDGMLGDGICTPGTGSCPNWVSDCVSGSCLHFDGVNDYVVIPYSDSLNMTGNMSIIAWVKLGSLPCGGCSWKGIVLKDKSSGNWPWGLQIDTCTPPGFMFTMNDTWAGYCQNTASSTGIWYYLVGSYDGISIKLYINGNLKDTKTFSQVVITNTLGVKIGLGDSYFNGTIDEVRIYNKALTPNETVVLTLGEFT